MSYCCVNCFNDKTLKDYIEENGMSGDCDFCDSQDILCINPPELEELFLPLVKLYKIVEDFMPMEDLKEREGQFIWEKLNEDWDVFAIYDYGLQEKLMRAIFPEDPRDGGDTQFLWSCVEREDEYWGDEDEVSDELEQKWNDFCDELKFGNRYFPTKDLDLELLDELLSYLVQSIEVNSLFFRSRLCDTDDKFDVLEMGKPPADKSQHGRANPKGINYLYVSSDVETAIAEIKPFSKDKVTVGKFVVKSRLKVVDLRNPSIDDPFRFGYNLEFMVTHLKFLRQLGIELTKTVGPEEAELEYIPLQYLCEFIKKSGFDGVVYKSSIADGHNMAIFNDSKLECVEAELYEVENTKYECKKII